jgi:hypothetical protein
MGVDIGVGIEEGWDGGVGDVKGDMLVGACRVIYLT